MQQYNHNIYAFEEVADLQLDSQCQNSVIVKNYAFGINRADVLQKMGKYPMVNDGASNVLGLEFSGIIQSISNDLFTNFKIGDKVMGIVSSGAYSEQILVPITQVLPLPQNLNFIQASALPEAIYTVWHALFIRAGLYHYISHVEKSSFLPYVYINAASSGIGIIAIQMCLAFGFNVIASTSNNMKIDKINSFMQTNANKHNFYLFCSSEITLDEYCELNKFKINFCLDMLGDLAQITKNMAINGSIVCIAFLQQAKSELIIPILMQKSLSIYATMLRLQSEATKAILSKQIYQYILPLIQNNSIKPLMHKVYNKDTVDNALNDMILNQHIGKLVCNLSI